MSEQNTRRSARRLNRQFRWIEGLAPSFRGPLTALRARGWWIVRLPVAILFILGGVFSFLPVLGVWMLPLGLLLLAIDVPRLRPWVSGGVVWLRRRASIWARWWRGKSAG